MQGKVRLLVQKARWVSSNTFSAFGTPLTSSKSLLTEPQSVRKTAGMSTSPTASAIGSERKLGHRRLRMLGVTKANSSGGRGGEWNVIG